MSFFVGVVAPERLTSLSSLRGMCVKSRSRRWIKKGNLEFLFDLICLGCANLVEKTESHVVVGLLSSCRENVLVYILHRA